MSTVESNEDRNDRTSRLTPLAGAFLLGRSVSRLRYLAVQQWLGASDAGPILQEQVENLIVHVRTVVTGSERGLNEEYIRNWFRNWQSALGSEWRADEVFDAWQLAIGRQSELDLPTINERCSQSPRGLVDDLEIFVTQYFDSLGQAAFELGGWLEQGLCRSDVARFLRPFGNDQVTSPDSASFEAQEHPSAGPLMLTGHFHVPGALPAPFAWRESLRQLWNELVGFGEFPITETSEGLASSDVTATAILNEVAEAFLTLALSRQSENAPATSEARPEHLGVVLDGDNFLVRRVGVNEVVDLSHDGLSWEILCLLVAHRDRYTSRDQLIEIWPRRGRSDA